MRVRARRVRDLDRQSVLPVHGNGDGSHALGPQQPHRLRGPRALVVVVGGLLAAAARLLGAVHAALSGRLSGWSGSGLEGGAMDGRERV